jgi:hypothetical protein
MSLLFVMDNKDIYKIFSPMKIIHDPEEKILYFKYFNQDRRFKKYVRYTESGVGMRFLDAFEDLKRKRINIAKEIYPKLNSKWWGNLNDLRNQYISILEADDKIYAHTEKN